MRGRMLIHNRLKIRVEVNISTMKWTKNVFYSSFLFDFFVKTFGGMKISGNFAMFLKHKLLFYYFNF